MCTARSMVAAGAAAGLLLAAGCAGSSKSSGAAPTVTSTTSSTVTRTVSPSPSSSDFSADYAAEHDGVVRITDSTCDSVGEGSGFLVAPNLVVTAAHVVDGETTLSITDPVSGASTPGQVVGLDTGRDVALVRTHMALTGHIFTFAGADPHVGSAIAAIGYPLNGPESIAEGLVSGLDRTITLDNGQSLSGLIQTDTSINQGNSGGPMINLDGSVAGIADATAVDAQGINYAVSATQAAPLIATWRQRPAPVPAADCQAPAPSPTQTQAPTTAPPTTAPSTTADAAVAVLSQYIDLINAQDYVDAYALLTPAGQQRVGSESQWAQGLAGSVYSNTQVVGTHSLPGGGFDVELTFSSTQPGQSCQNWDLDYHMLPGPSGGYLVDIAVPHNGGSGSTPC